MTTDTSRGPTGGVRRGTFATRLTLEVAGGYGMSPALCLKDTGLTPQWLANSDTEIDVAQELAVVRNVLTYLGDPAGLGAQIGTRANLGNLGVFGLAMLCSQTGRQAVTLALHYAVLSPTHLGLGVHEQRNRTELRIDDRRIPPELRTFFVERDLAALCSILPLLLGELVEAHLDVCMTASRGQHLAATLPISSIRFDRAHTVLSFPTRLLDQPLPNADEHTAALCERQCRDLLARRQRRDGVAERVRGHILRDVTNPPAMAAIAGELRIDPRTLRRHLAEEGTSFRQLHDEIRSTIAIELLVIDVSMESIAHSLGYAETSSFTHAFKRWYGVSPSSYRENARGQASR